MIRLSVITHFSLLFLFLSFQPCFAEKVAVVSYSEDGKKPALKIVQSRLEEILTDNEFDVFDREEANEIKRQWETLSDPTQLITAEDIIRIQEIVAFDKLLVAHVKTDVTKGVGGIYLATANVVLRVVNSQSATVDSHTTLTMGTPEFPVSEGITASSALINAVRRATESALQNLSELAIYDFTISKNIPLALKPYNAQSELKPVPSITEALTPVTPPGFDLSKGKRTKHAVQCAVGVKFTGFQVYGIKTSAFNIMSGKKSYESNLFIYDAQAQRITNQFAIEQGGRHAAGQRKKIYNSDVVDCEFVNSWKNLILTTNNQIMLFDLEKGIVLSALPFDTGMPGNTISLAADSDDSVVTVKSKKIKKQFVIGLAR